MLLGLLDAGVFCVAGAAGCLGVVLPYGLATIPPSLFNLNTHTPKAQSVYGAQASCVLLCVQARAGVPWGAAAAGRGGRVLLQARQRATVACVLWQDILGHGCTGAARASGLSCRAQGMVLAAAVVG